MAYESAPHDDEMITVHPDDEGAYEGRRGAVVVKAPSAEEALQKILRQTTKPPPPLPVEKP